ncbi:MAG TPA: dihydrodipicolinate synthase family protein [Candidatus Binatia bacterium]|jgi:dihydrodipicolinate synthase/N-acetylneuraminate lyase
MLTAKDLRGVVAMMPAFTAKNGGDPEAVDTIDADACASAVDKIIRDGVDAIATMGSFGECHTLLWEEKKKLTEATIAAVKKRVPVLIGCTTLNTRETLREVRFAQEAGADGVLCGVPFYYPSTADNAAQFYLDLADAFPKMGIGIYHNPPIHRVTIPVDAFKKLVTRPNIVFMKDSHRTPLDFYKLMNIVKDKIAVFVMQLQLYPYITFGASGCWSICAWMGPSPLIRLRDACFAGDWETAKQIAIDMSEAYRGPGRPGDLFWRENSHKLVINESGYCYAGPLRPPFRIVPQEIIEHSKKMAENWKALCRKYPLVSAPAKASAAR